VAFFDVVILSEAKDLLFAGAIPAAEDVKRSPSAAPKSYKLSVILHTIQFLPRFVILE
jgi:hypothetical protein